ncbi:MAG: hypothetical protein AB1405_14520 [Bdellovibrionota bacterium]
MIEITQISLVINAKNHNPTILNPDFLRYNKLVPESWELAGNPVCSDLGAVVRYKEGVTILSQPEQIIFTEELAKKKYTDSVAPGIARQYVQLLPHVSYTAIGINPSGFYEMVSKESLEKSMLEWYVSEGPWIEFQGTRPLVSMVLRYPRKLGGIQVTMSPGNAPDSSEKKRVGIRFQGNFHHDIPGETPGERIKSSGEILNSWQKDIEVFLELTEKVLLAKVK